MKAIRPPGRSTRWAWLEHGVGVGGVVKAEPQRYRVVRVVREGQRGRVADSDVDVRMTGSCGGDHLGGEIDGVNVGAALERRPDQGAGPGADVEQDGVSADSCEVEERGRGAAREGLETSAYVGAHLFQTRSLCAVTSLSWSIVRLMWTSLWAGCQCPTVRLRDGCAVVARPAPAALTRLTIRFMEEIRISVLGAVSVSGAARAGGASAEGRARGACGRVAGSSQQ